MKPDPDQSSQQKVDEILADCLRREDRGEAVDYEELLRRHPECEDEIQSYLSDCRAADQAIQRLKKPDISPASKPPALPAETDGAAHPTPTLALPPTSYRTAAEDSDPPAVDTQLIDVPGYEMRREIGRGGMGVVYEAVQKGTRRRVALKIVSTTQQASSAATQLFLREASVLSQLKHKRIVEFYEMGMAAGQIFLAMEYVETIDLREYLAEHPADVQQAYCCGIICQVLEALKYTHDQGLVHRDIKPQNVLVSRAERKLRTKLADFGLAKYVETAGFSAMTSDGETRGTLTFMAPEQFSNSRYAKAPCDIYAAGATLYYFLAGEYPYDFGSSRSIYDVCRTVLDTPPVPLHHRRPDVPGELAQVIDRALSKDPAKRYTAGHMYSALYPFARRLRA